MATKKGKTVQQILLAWGINKGWSVIPKSVTEERIKKNIEIDGWQLDAHEMHVMDHMEGRFKVCKDGGFKLNEDERSR